MLRQGKDTKNTGGKNVIINVERFEMLGQHTDLGDFTVSKGEPSSFRYHQASSLTLVHDRVTCKWLSRVYVRGTLYLCKVHPNQCMAGVLGAGELFTDGTEIGMNPDQRNNSQGKF